MVSADSLLAFVLIYASYVGCYLLRKNFPLLIPILGEKSIMDRDGAGFLSSAFEFFIGVAKLLCGPFVDRVASPGRLLTVSVAIAALSNFGLYAILVSLPDGGLRLTLAATFWSLNGLVQALAWPALARVFMNWYV